MRACGNCGKSGHNVRTCSNPAKPKPVKAKKIRVAKPKAVKAPKVRRNKYGTPTMCKYCRQREGHSAATCSVRKAHNDTAKVQELTLRQTALNNLAAMGFDVGGMIACRSGYPEQIQLKIIKSIRWITDVRADDRSNPNSRIEVNSRLVVQGISAGHTSEKSDEYWTREDNDIAVYPLVADATHNSADELSRVICTKNLPASKGANRGVYIEAVLISGVPTNTEKLERRIKTDMPRRRTRYNAKPKKEKKTDGFLTLPKNIL